MTKTTIIILFALLSGGATGAYFVSSLNSSEFNPPLVVEQPDDTTAPEGMVWVPGGVFQMGDADGKPDELPLHKVALDGFWMDAHEVTNRQFQEFVDATGYVTIAEKPPTLKNVAKNHLGEEIKILDEFNVPGSICHKPITPGEIDPDRAHYNWWEYRVGANWKQPEGEGSTIENRMDHPVVHVAWEDADAYCKWAGKQLPTEAQWEYAARGGLKSQMYPWGNERNPEGKWLHNIWQGKFPFENKVQDGFETTAPVKSFPPNEYGLYDLSGNVWEWCADFYHPEYYATSQTRNPPGPRKSVEPNLQDPERIKRVQRGGSFMCSEVYCTGYRVTARMRGAPDSGSFHCGFRCVVTPENLKEFQNAPAQQ